MRDGEGDAERDGKLVLFPHVCERPRFTGPFVFLEVGKKSILGEFLFYGIIDEMDPEISKKFEEQDKKLDAIFRSAEKTRKYFLWTLIISLLAVFLPLIGLAFVIPIYLKSLNFGALGF